jgi:hypothetical protein
MKTDPFVAVFETPAGPTPAEMSGKERPARSKFVTSEHDLEHDRDSLAGVDCTTHERDAW